MQRGMRLRGAVAALGVAAVPLMAGCGDGAPAADASAQVAPVPLHPDGLPDGLRIGVVVTLTSAPGQGSDWATASEGAQVAAYRYQLGGRGIDLVAVNDKGTSDGARAAVQQLEGDHVAGIVFATTGSHLGAGLAEAQSAGIAAVLPYPDDVVLPADAWTIAPDPDQVGAGLAAALSSVGAANPVVVDAGGSLPPGLPADHVLRFRSGGDPARLAHRVGAAHADAVVISGDAGTSATLAAALQGAGSHLPIVLTPQALSPRFAVALDGAGGSLDGGFTTVGTPSPDTTAMAATPAGSASSAYLSALRTAAASPSLKDFFDARPFSTVAADADAPSHDAVIALVTAAARAGSTDASAVLAQLRTLSLTAADGLAGPALSFAQSDAVSGDAVTVLTSTTQATDLRPATSAAQLYWFAEPAQ